LSIKISKITVYHNSILGKNIEERGEGDRTPKASIPGLLHHVNVFGERPFSDGHHFNNGIHPSHY
jgi:hypothetical protein